MARFRIGGLEYSKVYVEDSCYSEFLNELSVLAIVLILRFEMSNISKIF